MRLMMRMRVVLPAPLGPKSPKTLPLRTDTLTSLSAKWAAYCLTMLLASIICMIYFLIISGIDL
jgi:hypothetical protein